MKNLDLNFILTNFLDDFSSRLSVSEFNFFGNNSSSNIPLELSSRNNEVMWIALSGLIVSVILLALSRFGSSNYIGIFSRILLKNNSINKVVQEEFTLSSPGSILLIFNYIISSTTLLYLAYLHYFIHDDLKLFYFLPIIPIYFFLWPLLCFNFLSFITNEKAAFSENKKNVIVLSQIMGVLFSIILLLWAFNLKWSIYFIYSFIFLICFFWLYKFLRGIIFSFQHNISWYYIILYFCTLEILPIISIYLYLLSK